MGGMRGSSLRETIREHDVGIKIKIDRHDRKL